MLSKSRQCHCARWILNDVPCIKSAWDVKQQSIGRVSVAAFGSVQRLRIGGPSGPCTWDADYVIPSKLKNAFSTLRRLCKGFGKASRAQECRYTSAGPHQQKLIKLLWSLQHLM